MNYAVSVRSDHIFAEYDCIPCELYFDVIIVDDWEDRRNECIKNQSSGLHNNNDRS